MGVEAVESRIAQIQSSIAALSPGRGQPVATQSAGTAGAQPPAVGGAASGDGFARVLSETMGSASNSTQAGNNPTSGATRTGSASSAQTTGATGSTGGAGTASGDAIVATAKKHLGVPYVWGGNSPSQGFDCSGLVKHVMNELGVDMPRVARDQAKVGTEIGSLAEAQPGDLLGMRNGKHIAIYLGDNKILHAPQPGENVSIRSLFAHDDIDTIRRVVPAGATVPSSDQAARAAFEAVSS